MFVNGGAQWDFSGLHFHFVVRVLSLVLHSTCFCFVCFGFWGWFCLFFRLSGEADFCLFGLGVKVHLFVC